jgi:ribosomal protein L7/L12
MAGGMEWSELQPLFTRIGERLQVLETQVIILSAAAGIPFEPATAPVPEEILALARAGKTIEAIKQYRALSGASLEDAKNAVLGL